MAFVCSTDLPFLHPELVRRVLRPFGDPGTGQQLDVVLPVARGYPQPLAAAYRTRLAPRVAALVAADRLRPAFIFDDATVLRLDDQALLTDAALQAADPTLESVVNVNDPAEYEAARARAAPEVTVECFGVIASRAGRGRAWCGRPLSVQRPGGPGSPASGTSWPRSTATRRAGTPTCR